jgi:hypothetical protein
VKEMALRRGQMGGHSLMSLLRRTASYVAPSGASGAIMGVGFFLMAGFLPAVLAGNRWLSAAAVGVGATIIAVTGVVRARTRREGHAVLIATPLERWGPQDRVRRATRFASEGFESFWLIPRGLPDDATDWAFGFAELTSFLRISIESQTLRQGEEIGQLGMILMTPEAVAWKLGELDWLGRRDMDLYQEGLAEEGFFHALSLGKRRQVFDVHCADQVVQNLAVADGTDEFRGEKVKAVVVKFGAPKSYMKEASNDAWRRGAREVLTLELPHSWQSQIAYDARAFSVLLLQAETAIEQFCSSTLAEEQTVYVYPNMPTSVAFALGALLSGKASFKLMQWQRIAHLASDGEFVIAVTPNVPGDDRLEP